MQIVFRMSQVLVLLVVIAGANRMIGQEKPALPPRPLYPLRRYDEDWSFLSDPAKRDNFWDPIKFIPLNEDRNVFLSLGGGIRETYERFHNTNFGLGPDDQDGYLLQRYLFHVDLHAGQRFRFFGELNSSLEDGRTGGPRPLDEDKLDVHQGHRIGFPSAGRWREIFNSDVHECWMNFSVEGDDGAVYANDKMPHSPPSSAALTLPANSILIFARG